MPGEWMLSEHALGLNAPSELRHFDSEVVI